MEAKEQIDNILNKWSRGHCIQNSMIPGLTKLVEISFKAGYEVHKAELCSNCDTPLIREGNLYRKLDESKKAGIKEVIKDLAMIDKESYDTRDFTRRVCDLIVEWQAFLKSKGLNV